MKPSGYAAWKFKSFPICGWHGPRGTERDLRLYIDANFNVAMLETEEAVAQAEALGLPVLLSHPQVNHKPFSEQGLARALGVAQRHSNVVGFLLWDEPSPVNFPEIAKWTEAFRTARPDLLPWVNLHPIKIVEEELPGVTEYGPYLDGYVEAVKPDVLSYDNYGALRESNDDIVFYKNFEDTYFYYNMAVFRDRSLRYNLPFWGFALVNPHWTYFTPTEADIRFQVYSLLAYGAKGLWYFTCDNTRWKSFPPDMEGTEIDKGLINTDGSVTERYPIAKAVNAEMQALGPTLLRLTSTSIHHLDEPKLPPTYYLEDPKEVLPLRREPLPADGILRSVTGGRPLAGLFKDADGNDYVMVMNKTRRKMDVVTRVELGLDRHRDLLTPSHTLGQKFHADAPISAVGILFSSYSKIGQGATIRIRKGGPGGEEVALWKYYNLFADSAVIVRFPVQPAGKYYIEVSDVAGKSGWWSKKVADGKGGAYADGKPVAGVDRNFIAYGAPDLSPEKMTLTFAPDVASVEEVSKKDGSLVKQMLANGKLTLTIAQGDGHLFRVTRTR